MRIYVDESGTHGEDWLIIGMLFVPDHGILHSDLCAVKENAKYFNRSPKRKARYKETHLAKFRSNRDFNVAKEWIDLFGQHTCFYRSIVVDWSIWDGSYFGDPFEPQALKQRKAYKKWAEMLLHPEAKTMKGARLFLDRLRLIYGYDVLEHLEKRFKRGYRGASPRIKEYQATESWKDANQCLQLCDVLTGSIYQKLVPSGNEHKLATADYLYESLKTFGVRDRRPGFWRGYAKNSLSRHFPKFSEWYWRPGE